MSQGKLFEGFTIDAQQGNLARFDIQEQDERYFVVGQRVVLVIAATIGAPNFAHTKEGGLKRINKLVPDDAVHVATGVMRDELVEFYSLWLPGETLFSPTAAPLPAPVITSTPIEADAETGEIAGDEDYETYLPGPEPSAVNGGSEYRDPALAAFFDEPIREPAR